MPRISTQRKNWNRPFNQVTDTSLSRSAACAMQTSPRPCCGRNPWDHASAISPISPARIYVYTKTNRTQIHLNRSSQKSRSNNHLTWFNCYNNITKSEPFRLTGKITVRIHSSAFRTMSNDISTISIFAIEWKFYRQRQATNTVDLLRISQSLDAPVEHAAESPKAPSNCEFVFRHAMAPRSCWGYRRGPARIPTVATRRFSFFR